MVHEQMFCMQPSLDTPRTGASKLTQCEYERIAKRAAYRRNVRQLCVYTREPFEPASLVAIITITHTNRAWWQFVTCNGGLSLRERIACNGSVSKRAMRNKLECDYGTEIFAKVLHYSDLGYERY